MVATQSLGADGRLAPAVGPTASLPMTTADLQRQLKGLVTAATPSSMSAHPESVASTAAEQHAGRRIPQTGTGSERLALTRESYARNGCKSSSPLSSSSLSSLAVSSFDNDYNNQTGDRQNSSTAGGTLNAKRAARLGRNRKRETQEAIEEQVAHKSCDTSSLTSKDENYDDGDVDGDHRNLEHADFPSGDSLRDREWDGSNISEPSVGSRKQVVVGATCGEHSNSTNALAQSIESRGSSVKVMPKVQPNQDFIRLDVCELDQSDFELKSGVGDEDVCLKMSHTSNNNDGDKLMVVSGGGGENSSTTGAFGATLASKSGSRIETATRAVAAAAVARNQEAEEAAAMQLQTLTPATSPEMVAIDMSSKSQLDGVVGLSASSMANAGAESAQRNGNHITHAALAKTNSGSNLRQQKAWNYGQLVTSIMDQRHAIGAYEQQQLHQQNYLYQQQVNCGITNSTAANLTEQQQQQQLNSHSQSLTYFGFKRPPKRLVYFYDINDDVDEEIDFLTNSLETKSYATSLLGQHDHYLDNIAKSQAAAARLKAANKLQTQYRVSMYKAENEPHIRALALESSFAGSGTNNPDSPPQPLLTLPLEMDTEPEFSSQLDPNSPLDQSNFRKRSSSQLPARSPLLSATASFLTGHGIQHQHSSAPPDTAQAGGHQRKSIDLYLTPHWSSVPSHLNSTSIAMMRFYQTSLTTNLLNGKRERALLNERGHYDKACCRVDYGAYAKALDVFVPKDGCISNLIDLKADQRQEDQRGSQSHNKDVNVNNSNDNNKTTNKEVDINLGVIFEPFRMFPSIAGNVMDPPGNKSSRQNVFNFERANRDQLEAEGRAASRRTLANRWQRSLLVSLENYAIAKAKYEEQQAARRRQRAQEMSAMGNLNRTSQAIRRGSVVVLNKLKLLHSGGQSPTPTSNTSHAHQTSRQSRMQPTAEPTVTPSASKDNLRANKSVVPRLSLTKAESLATGSPDLQLDGRLHQQQEGRGEVAIQMSSNESLIDPKRLSVSSGLDKFAEHHGDLSMSICGQASPMSTSSSIQMNQPAAGQVRHSIANLPVGLSVGQQVDSQSNQSSDGRINSPRSSIMAAAKRSQPRASLVGWFTPRSLTASGDQLGAGFRNSCFSQTSKTTSVSTIEKCSKILRPNLRRRRSFSGPYEWLQREAHRRPNDLMLTPVKRLGNVKRKFKKVKPQKSCSSDYHSLNNRRVYRLDSRGFQTKLKGTFYVITNDPLIGSSGGGTFGQQQQFQAPLAIGGGADFAGCGSVQLRNLDQFADSSYDFNLTQQQQQQQFQQDQQKLDRVSSNELESSFFNTSNDDGQSIGDRSQSRDTNARSTMSRDQTSHSQRTFLLYFHWTKWMIQRRHYSLFIFSPQSRIRRFCTAVTSRKEFDYFVLFFISMNCVTLAMERPKIPPWSYEREFLTKANYYFTFLFTLEMALKVISKGLYYGRDAYLSDSWNIMDGTLVGFSLFDLLLSVVADRSPRIFAILRVFRLLRSLRPLRVINRLMGLKLVVQTLLLSLRPIGNIVLICCTFFIIFGILGVQLFKGTFYYCDGPDPLEIMRTVKTKEDCLMNHKNRWVNRKYNFDNLGQALMALFVLSSKDGWVNIMYTGLDAVGVDIQPRENYNEWRLLYFISFLLLVAFFVLNMFVGVVVENFHRCRKEQEMEEKARRAEKRQRKLDKRRRKLREPPYYSNYGKFRLLLHKWVTGGYFDLLIAAVIGFNVVFMSLEHYQMPPKLVHLLKVSNYFFTAAFILEAAIKTTALGMRRYLKDRWNQLDVLIVAMSIIGIIFEEMDSFTLPINPTLLRVLRVMRIARVLKLLKMAKGIRALLDTVMQALPQVGNLGLLFFLLFFIFAALGVELFGRLECNDEYPCSGLMDQHAHFQNFGLAFLTLFRVATGDNWNGIMKDTLRDKCDPSSNCLKNCCVSQIIAPLYFVIFVLLAQFVLVNVVVAVLMKHLEESHYEMEIDEEYELDKQLAEELEAKKRALMEARERQKLYWC